MIEVSLQQLTSVLDAQLIGENKLISSISTDTRKIDQGALFIALVGEKFDAHDFATQAVDGGAGAYWCSVS